MDVWVSVLNEQSHLVDWSNEIPPNSELGYEPVRDVTRGNYFTMAWING
jgi:hypothetical protein